MARRRLRERARVAGESRQLVARGVVAVGERAQRVERDVLAQREPECEWALRQPGALLQLVEGEPERSPIRRMGGETEERPEGPARERLPEQLDVGVAAAEEAPVERLERRPGNRCDRPGRCGAPARGERSHRVGA